MPTKNRDSSRVSPEASMELICKIHTDPTARDKERPPIVYDRQSPSSKNFSDWNTWEKRLIIFAASLAALFSPLSANIYFPIFNVLADDLHVSNTLINLTVTTYMVSLLVSSHPAEWNDRKHF